MPRRKKNPQPPPTTPIDSCKHCQRSHLKLSKCSKCKEVFYCSANCQQKDWIHHKKVCKPEETKQQSPVSPLPIEEESCNNCGKSGVKLSICSQCHGAKYCSKECQKAEWSKHKVDCKKNSLPTSCTPAKSQRKCPDCSNICTEGSEFCDSCRLKERFANMYSKKDKCHDCTNISERNSAYCARCITLKYYSMNPFNLATMQQKCRDCPLMCVVDSVYCTICITSKYSKTVTVTDIKIQKCRDCYMVCDSRGYCIGCRMRRTSGNGFPSEVPDKVYQIAKARYPGFTLITDFGDINQASYENRFMKGKQVMVAIMVGDGGHIFRPSMILRDDQGLKLRIIFHLEVDDQPNPNQWALFQIGNFICILYPKIHHFVDGSVGFRVESTNLVSFIR